VQGFVCDLLVSQLPLNLHIPARKIFIKICYNLSDCQGCLLWTSPKVWLMKVS